MSIEHGTVSEAKPIVTFHRAFLDSVRRHGRLFELELAGRYKLATRDLLTDLKINLGMLTRGKVRLTASNVKGKGEIRRMFRETGTE
jgi:heterodisulfide reductase subunit C